MQIIEELKVRGVSFKSLCDAPMDTTTASGEFIFNIFSSLAQFERKLIQERTKAGLNAARARGRLGGRKKMLAADPKIQTAKKMHKDHEMSIDNICKTLKISRATFYMLMTQRHYAFSALILPINHPFVIIFAPLYYMSSPRF